MSSVWKTYLRFWVLNNFLWSTAATQNSWKSIRPSPSRSISLKISSHFRSLKLKKLESCSSSVAFSNSYLEIEPSLLTSILWNRSFRTERSSESCLRPKRREVIILLNLEHFENWMISFMCVAYSSGRFWALRDPLFSVWLLIQSSSKRSLALGRLFTVRTKHFFKKFWQGSLNFKRYYLVKSGS